MSHSQPVIKVEQLSKLYRLGHVSTGSISHDLNRWWSGIRGKEDPYLAFGETNNQKIKTMVGGKQARDRSLNRRAITHCGSDNLV